MKSVFSGSNSSEPSCRKVVESSTICQLAQSLVLGGARVNCYKARGGGVFTKSSRNVRPNVCRGYLGPCFVKFDNYFVNNHN